MKILLKKSSNIFVSAQASKLDTDGAIISGMRAPSVTSQTHQLIDVESVPQIAKPGQSSYDPSTEQWTHPVELYTALIPELKEKIDAQRDLLLYVDVDLEFPDGVVRTVQYRNEKDHRALSSVVLAAMANSIANDPTAKVKFRTKDDHTNLVESSDFISIAMGVMLEKEGLYQIAWDKKDYLDALDPEDEDYATDIANFDPLSGWSEE
ncbi:MAG: hypothetical protein RKH07_12740 [Gammaproteobacteria bacterium]